MRIERETACDDGALRAGERPTACARVLLDTSGRITAETHRLSVATTMALQSRLERRVHGIIATNQSRRPVGRAAGHFLVVIAIAAVAAAGVINPFGPSMTPFAQPHHRTNGGQRLRVTTNSARNLPRRKRPQQRIARLSR
jgi:beta-lactamase regulating signal transducer with metallopeptidase domain